MKLVFVKEVLLSQLFPTWPNLNFRYNIGMSKKLKFIDLFSGCGGLSCGLELAGHECLLGVDFDKDSIESFKLNHKNSKTFLGDIGKLTNKKLSEILKNQPVDMVVGGPPCQGFSTVGKGQASDSRNYLFKEFVRVVKFLNPKVVLFENVTGLLAKKNEHILSSIFRSFEKLGYEMDAKVMSSEEYGVPERRRRTIIIGSKKIEGSLFPEITHGDRGRFPLNNVGNAFEDLRASDGSVYNHNVETAQIKKVIDRKRLKYVPEGRFIRYEKDELKYLPKRLRYDLDWDKLSERRFRQAKLQRLDRKLPSPTILTSRTSYYHPTEDRYLTAREAAACQSFPNDFIFCGSLTSQFRQIGNAVPPLLACQIGLAITRALSSKSLQRNQNKNKNFKSNAFHYQSKTVA
jgi:DNA (cytosine-5)-methyltransferase 1